MGGLDPGIHHLCKRYAKKMDPRVKPAGDGGGWAKGRIDLQSDPLFSSGGPGCTFGAFFSTFSPPEFSSLTASTYSEAQAPSTLLITGATIIDGLADAPIRDRALLIEGNIIRGLPPADAAVPAGAQVLDLARKIIIPRLVDSPLHLDAFLGELLVNSGL